MPSTGREQQPDEVAVAGRTHKSLEGLAPLHAFLTCEPLRQLDRATGKHSRVYKVARTRFRRTGWEAGEKLLFQVV